MATFSPAGSWDGTIKFWDWKAGREIATLQGQRAVHALDFSADGKRLVSAGADRTVKIWDVATRQELCTLTEPAEVSAVTFSPDDQAIATGPKDGVVRLWSAGGEKAEGAAVPRRP